MRFQKMDAMLFPFSCDKTIQVGWRTRKLMPDSHIRIFVNPEVL